MKKSISKLRVENIATVFGYYVKNPQRYGVINFDDKKKIISIDEKPKKPKSNYAVVGLYFYPNSVIKISESIKPSARGEFEITSVNNIFLSKNKLNVELLDRGCTWLDTGTPDSILEASNFIQTIEKRQGKKVACIEEIAFNLGLISLKQLRSNIPIGTNNEYDNYLLKIKNDLQ